MQRQTAVRVRIVDIVSGEWVKKEGMEPSYVVTPGKETVSRARIVGTVVGKFDSDDGNFSSVTIDDATGVIRAKLWRETALLKTVRPGNLVSVIGKVREYDGEIYIVPELINNITPDEESLARLEVIEKIKGRSGQGKAKHTHAEPAEPKAKAVKHEKAQEHPAHAAPAAHKAPHAAPAAKTAHAGAVHEKKAEAPKEAENPRKKVLALIEKNPDGIRYADLLTQSGLPEEDVENVINEVLGEGVCYEPIPGKIKKI
jgi:RPA family protein